MDEAKSRAELRDQSRKQQSQKNRRLLLGIGGGVLVVAIIAAVVVLVGGGGDDKGKSAEEATTVVPNTNVSLQLGDVSTDSAGPPVQLTPEQSQAILKVVGDYLTAATVDPLRSAKPAGDLSALFAAGALARVTGPDRAVMLDEGLPKVTGDLDVTAQPVAVVGLADQGGGIVLATATIDLDIQGATAAKGDPLRILRKGDLVLESGRVRRRGRSRRSTSRSRGAAAGSTPSPPPCRPPPRPRDPSDAEPASRSGTRAGRSGAPSSPWWSSPLLCGLIVASSVTAAWLALGSPTPGRGRGVVPGHEARRRARTPVHPTSRSSP